MARPACPTKAPPIALAVAVAIALLPLAGCEREPEPPRPPPPEQATFAPVDFAELPGWQTDSPDQALPALLRSCARIEAAPPDRKLGAAPLGLTVGDLAPACAAAAALPPNDPAAARAFFESWFRPYRVGNNGDADGLFTGYFEIELQAALTRDAAHSVPVYRLPEDHVTVDLGDFDPTLAGRSVVGRVEGGKLKPYFQRGDIDGGVLAGRGLELLWLADPLDAFMLHIQGSGRVVLVDGRATRIGYAGNNGYSYNSIGAELIARGELQPGQASWTDIRTWMQANPAKVESLLAVNRRYIFFREIVGDGPVGAQGVALTAGRSMAIDPRYIPLGLPLWLDTKFPGDDTDAPLQRLMIAQDTGSAIKGPVRGDFFWGTGDEALRFAGRMKSHGGYYLLLPAGLAARIATN